MSRPPAPRRPGDAIRRRLPAADVPGLPGLRMHLAGPGSRLSALAGDRPPYWGYAWAGGLALARYVAARPGLVAGREVVDLGAGGGVATLAAARAGAAVLAAETDPMGRAALRANLALNGLHARVTARDLTAGPALAGRLILAGDVFYEAGLAARVLAWLELCEAAGSEVLVGDPFRAPLPLDRLELLSREARRGPGAARPVTAGVFRLRPRG